MMKRVAGLALATRFVFLVLKSLLLYFLLGIQPALPNSWTISLKLLPLPEIKIMRPKRPGTALNGAMFVN
jgi:hypothetical protein